MGHKNSQERIIWFHQEIQENRFPNAMKLAARFEVSNKTAQRDIDLMRDRLNCPLFYDKRRKGYCYTDTTFSLPMIYLSSEQIGSLLLARKMISETNNAGIGNNLSQIIQKITTILVSHGVDIKAVENAVSFKIISHSPASDEVFMPVFNACLKKRSLSFSYHSPARMETTERTVNPYHLLNYMGSWHLIAYCHTRQELRDFLLSRMSIPKILDNKFQYMHGFDITEYINNAFGLYTSTTTTEVTLRFKPEKAKWIKGQLWHKKQKEMWGEDGSLELSFPVACFDEVLMETLKHGSGVEVLKPEALRSLVKSEAKKIANIYR